MQFHLNGFKTGDPSIIESDEGGDGSRPLEGLPLEADVVIVGSGPTGLTLAAQLAAFPTIKTVVLEQKPGRLLLGQADGVACRTVEMFEAFGFSERVLKEAYYVNETTFWKPDDNDRQTIVRSGRIQDTEDGLSEFPHVILNQARVHDFYLDVMRGAPARLEPLYSRRVVELNVAPTEVDFAEGSVLSPDHPITVKVERLDPSHEGEVETIKARFVVGCDGARSVVRRSIHRTLRGDSANQAWGVMDVLAVTDFPDIRLKTAIHSANEGNLLIIPREGGYLVRLYIELDKMNPDERITARNLTADHVIAAAQRILRPYELDVKEVAWWSVYEIGQRLCDKFDDVPEEVAGRRIPRVFIAGDACHTHSPKAGQGMNMSMADSFNLGWKLASTLLERCSPQLLNTYSQERRAVAEELIDFDRKFAKMFSAPPRDPSDPSGKGIDPAEFQKYFVKQGRFTAGTAIRYTPSTITGEPTFQSLASGLEIGMRFHSAPVIRLADAKRVHLGHVVKADGRWRIFIFAPAEDPGGSSRLKSICEFLGESPDSPVRRFTPAGADVDSVIDVRAVFQQSHRELALQRMPPFLLPGKGRYRLIDYEKMFCADLKTGEDIFAMRGVDRIAGCLVIVRPDQYVAHVLPIEEQAALARFFERFMLPAR